MSKLKKHTGIFSLLKYRQKDSNNLKIKRIKKESKDALLRTLSYA
jgi:hypothetical protein